MYVTLTACKLLTVILKYNNIMTTYAESIEHLSTINISTRIYQLKN